MRLDRDAISGANTTLVVVAARSRAKGLVGCAEVFMDTEEDNRVVPESYKLFSNIQRDRIN